VWWRMRSLFDGRSGTAACPVAKRPVVEDEKSVRRAQRHSRMPGREATIPPLRQKRNKPPCGAFCVSRRVWWRMRSLFDQPA
jgi:hypothetical protein